MKDLDEYIKEAIDNIHKDRGVTQDLLKDIMRFIAVDDENHRKVGPIAAKYVETLQRSNEQLVKIVALLQKKTVAGQNLTKEDKDEIFDLIQGNK